MSTTIPAEPPVMAEHVSGATSTSDYKEQQKKQLTKPKDIKSFGELAAEGIEVTQPDIRTTKVEPVAAEDIGKLLKKKTGAEKLRELEQKEAGGGDTHHTSDALDELESLSQEQPKKPEKKGKEENFAELRKKAEASEKALQDRQTEFQTKEEAYRKREKELNELVEKSAFRDSPKFKETYQAPVEAARSELAAFAKEMTDTDTYVSQMLTMKGKELVAFVEEKAGTATIASEMLRMVNEVHRREAAMNTALDQHESKRAVLQAKEQDQASRQKEELETNFNDLAARMSSKLSYFRKDNPDAQGRIDAAKAIITGTAPQEDIMVAPFLAVIARDTLKENVALKAELAKYKQRVKDENTGEPTVRGDAGEDEETSRNGKPLGMMDIVKKKFGRK